MLPAMSTSSPRPYDEETNDDTSVSEAVVGASPILSTAAPTRSTPEIPAVDAQLSTPSHSPTPSQIATTSSRSSEPATGGAQPKAQPIPLIPHVAGTGMVVSPAAFRVSPVPIPPKHNLEDSDATRPESEKDIRSQRGSTGDQGSEGGGAGGSYYGTGARGQAGMPRNFRISVDGYTLLRDDDGTFAAYRINVTAGLHQWQVLRRFVHSLVHSFVHSFIRSSLAVLLLFVRSGADHSFIFRRCVNVWFSLRTQGYFCPSTCSTNKVFKPNLRELANRTICMYWQYVSDRYSVGW